MIDRRVFDGDEAMPTQTLRDGCIGCRDCQGTCLALLQLVALPDILLTRRRARQ